MRKRLPCGIALVVTLGLTLSGAAPALGQAPCTDFPDVPGALCGSVEVPLDRADPSSATTTVSYVLLPRRDTSVPSEGTMMLNPGGPGEAASGFAGFLAGAFAAHFERRDLLLVDPRGTGRSDALTCRAFSDLGLYFAPRNRFIAAIGACGRELGERARHYGSATVADDYDAVRAALGLEQIDFWGDSYGTYLAAVYAGRYPERVRSIVLSGAYPIDFDPYGRDNLAASRGGLRLVCARTRACRPAAVMRDLAAVATRLRRKPVRFTVVAGERRFRVRLDEEILAQLFFTSGNPALYGALPAALAAARDGDLAPLRRVAETRLLGFAAFFKPGTVPRISLAQNAATKCHDYPRTFSYSDSPAVRRAAYARALGELDRRDFAPFSPRAWTRAVFEAGDACIAWPDDPTAARPLAPGTPMPDVPVLVLSGDLDANTPPPAGRQVADLFPRATQVVIPNAGHTPTGDPCAVGLALRFVDTLTVEEGACADADATVVVPRAAVRAAGLRLVRARAPRLQRRALAVLAATVADLSARAPELVPWPALTALRGGRYVARRDGTVRLARVRVVRDAVVSGVLAPAERRVTGTVRLDGSGVADGRLRIRLATTGRGRATGMLGGRRVDLAFRVRSRRTAG